MSERTGVMSSQSDITVPGVVAMELGIAFMLFRSLVNTTSSQEVLPLTDPYVDSSLSNAENLDWAIRTVALECGDFEGCRSIIERISAFVRLLRHEEKAQETEWSRLVERHNDVSAIVHAIAWCPLIRGHAFEIVPFLRIAEIVPDNLVIDMDDNPLKPN
jgi:hypothetical protein